MNLYTIIKKKHYGDEEQLEFIFSNEKYIAVTAPAGCGKTTAMISKLALEIASGSCPINKKILAMTFSVNASLKIKDDVNRFLPSLIESNKNISKKVEVANYHSFCFKLLSMYGYVLHHSFKKIDTFKILADNDLLKYLDRNDENILKDFDNIIKSKDIKMMYTKFDKIYDIYLPFLEKNVITYNAILIFALKLLQMHSVQHFYSNIFSMVIIDEFQDTNILCFEIITKIITNNKLIVMGDRLQRIYGFLGAQENAFDKIVSMYNMKEIEFKNNYRFKGNERLRGMDKFLRNYAELGESLDCEAEIPIKSFDSYITQYQFISEGLKRIKKIDKSATILFRTMPKNIDELTNNLTSHEINYFNWLFKESDYHIDDIYENFLSNFLENNKRGNLITKNKNDMVLSNIRTNKKNIDINSEIFNSHYKLMEVMLESVMKLNASNEEKFDIVVQTLENKSLNRFMDNIKADVFLMTIHASKGLEWDYVFIANAHSSNFPSYYLCKQCEDKKFKGIKEGLCIRNIDSISNSEFKEELSLFYVAITRAKREVFITVPKYNNGWKTQASCFLSLNGLNYTKFDYEKLIT